MHLRRFRVDDLIADTVRLSLDRAMPFTARWAALPLLWSHESGCCPVSGSFTEQSLRCSVGSCLLIVVGGSTNRRGQQILESLRPRLVNELLCIRRDQFDEFVVVAGDATFDD